MVFTDIPVKEGEKHVTIAGYWIFVRQEETFSFKGNSKNWGNGEGGKQHPA